MPRGGRAQTSIDFLIGVGVFLLAIAFVFGAIPGMIDPFAESQENVIVADRAVSQLAGGMLGDPASPGTLNETCTFAFFNVGGVSANGSNCPVSFDKANDLPTRLGIDDRYSVNVTLQRNVTGDAEFDVLCSDGDSVTECPTGTRLAEGPSPPTSTGSVIITRRTVFLDGKDLTLVVRLW